MDQEASGTCQFKGQVNPHITRNRKNGIGNAPNYGSNEGRHIEKVYGAKIHLTTTMARYQPSQTKENILKWQVKHIQKLARITT